MLFLVADPGTVVSIAYSGVGRLPVSNAEGNQTVGLYGSLLPKELKRQIGVAPENQSGMVELTILKKYVQQLAENPLAKRKRLRLTTR